MEKKQMLSIYTCYGIKLIHPKLLLYAGNFAVYASLLKICYLHSAEDGKRITIILNNNFCCEFNALKKCLAIFNQQSANLWQL